MNNKSTVSYPFEPTVSDKDRIIDQGIESLRAQHRTAVEQHRTDFDRRADSEFLRAEAKRKAAWITAYHDNHWMPLKYPYGAMSREAQYRVSLPFDERLAKLAAVELWGELLYCFIVRFGTHNKISIQQVKDLFSKYGVATDGDCFIVSNRSSHDRAYVTTGVPSAEFLVHAKGLSRQLSDIILGSADVNFGTVTWHPTDERNSDEY